MVSLEITDKGIERVIVYANNPAEQQEAHLILARCAVEIQQLNQKLKAPAKRAPARQCAVNATAAR